jgi:hypothetical protein
MLKQKPNNGLLKGTDFSLFYPLISSIRCCLAS